MKGIFKPLHPEKYLGNVRNIVYRSSWELKVLMRLDSDPNVLSYSSEEVVIPYKSPLDGRRHKYYVDFYVKTKSPTGIIQERLIEVKPKKQTIPPNKINIKAVKKPTARRYINEVMTWQVNNSKWQAAKEYCENRGWLFQLMTEEDIF